jgi:predicted metal-dependent hydrolase
VKFSQLEFLWPKARRPFASGTLVSDGNGSHSPIIYRRNPLARRYRLFVDREGRPRVTIPRRGSQREAEEFVARHKNWIIDQLQRHATRCASAQSWQPGTQILFRGQLTPIESFADSPSHCVRVGSEVIPLPSNVAIGSLDLRPIIEKHLRRLAAIELPQRTLELAAMQESPVRKVTIRNQRTRWGSCSRRGTVSLNWRLVQVPVAVRDYIILHELMHLREMNHSRRFWALVAKACPDFKSSEAWLRAHSPSLL